MEEKSRVINGRKDGGRKPETRMEKGKSMIEEGIRKN